MKHLKFFAALCCVAAVFAACETNRLDDGGPGAETEGSEQIGNYYAVDLGLPSGLKWATCNVGASTPEGYGNYYAWGETTTKSSYSYDNYKWSNDGCDTFTKYNTSSSYGAVDNKTVLELADDAARANWGGAWRMPTYAEWGELLDECTWEWKDGYKGITAGYLVTSNINGNSIFLPAAGCRDNDDLNFAGNDGYYWSSSLYAGYPYSAWNVSFVSDIVNGGDGSRCYGRSVRPVLFGE